MGGNSGREVAGGFFEVAQEMFHADFFRFFRLDGGGDVHERFCCCSSVVFDFFDGKVGVCGDSLRGVDRVDMDDDEDWVGDVISQESVDGEIGASELGTGMIPPNDFFTGYA